MISYNDFKEKLKEFEGLRLKAYKCPSGVLTIGYGHTHSVTSNMVISNEIAEVLLEYDITMAFSQLMSLNNSFIGYHEGLRFALIDFVFNFGITKYKNSTLRKVVESIDYSKSLSHNDIERLSIQFYRWVHSNGRVLKGLERRRAWEVSLLYD